MIAGGFVLVLVLVVAGGVLLMQTRQFNKEFAPMTDVCRGKQISAAPRYTNNTSIHPAVGVENGTNGWDLDNRFIPSEARAESVAETQLVLCLGKVEDIFIESCPYTDLNNPRGPIIGRIERYYYKQDARLIEAKTGRVVSRQTFTGKSARLCKEVERLPGDGRNVILKGTRIPQDEIYRWAQSQLVE